MRFRNFLRCCLIACAVLTSSVSGQTKFTDAIPLDEVWAGTNVTYSAVSFENSIYVAYYNKDRFLTVAEFNTDTKEVKKKVLSSRFIGWDAHNNTALIVDKGGNLHVAGNMHANPLVYARTLQARDFNSLAELNEMIGRDEDKVTYPEFFNVGDKTFFSYRNGGSGDGAEYLNSFDGKHWSRTPDAPLFAPDPKGPKVNAYRTKFLRTKDGYYHVAYVWRQTPDVGTNFNVNYAKTKDFVKWQKSTGEEINLPLTPTNSEIVDRIEVNSGLLNNVRLGFTQSDLPVISYIKYDSNGHTQIYHGIKAANGWAIKQATDWTYKWVLNGTGTIKSKISFGGVQIKDGEIVEDVYHEKEGRFDLHLDRVNLAATLVPKQKSLDAPAPLRPLNASGRSSANSPYSSKTRPISSVGNEGAAGSIEWQTLDSSNNDRPRTCEQLGREKGCSWTSTIYIRAQKSN